VGDVSLFRALDGYRFYAHVDRPTGEVRGRILMLHGIRSHAGWYERSCRELAECGYEVHFLDRRGAGWNTARRGDCPNFQRLIDDCGEYILDLRRARAALPLFVTGISWGGKLAVALAARYPTIISGIALLCPGLKPAIQPPLATRLRIALAAKLRPTKLFPIPLNEPELFTTSPEWQEFIDRDRFGLREATARFLFNSFRFDRLLRRRYAGVTCPVLLMLAGKDRILDNSATRKLLAKFTGAKSIAVIDYPDAHHTLEFEDVGHRWLRDLTGWLDCATA
jgi:alpha-beta hydrolase superfamily lysophospholipase